MNPQETSPTSSDQNKNYQSNTDSNSQTLQKPFAGIIMRWAALILDYLLFSVLLIPVGFVVYLFQSQEQTLIMNIFFYAGHYIYSIVLLKLYGATWGKQFFGLKVERTDGKKITWTRALLREIVGQTLSSLILGLGYVWAIFDERKQALHDKIANTVVVQEKPIGKAKRVLAYIITLGLPLIAILGVLAVIVLVAINPVEQLARARDTGRKAAIDQLARALESYYSKNGQFPVQDENWLNTLHESGETGGLDNTKPFGFTTDKECGPTASRADGFCYEVTNQNAIIYRSLEAEQKGCTNGKVTWYVYSTENNSSGIICLINNEYPQLNEKPNETESIDAPTPTLSVSPTQGVTITPKPTATTVPKGVRSYGKKTVENDQKITLLSASKSGEVVTASFLIDNPKDFEILTTDQLVIRNNDYFRFPNESVSVNVPPFGSKTITVTFNVGNELKTPPYWFLWMNPNGVHVVDKATELGMLYP